MATLFSSMPAADPSRVQRPALARKTGLAYRHSQGHSFFMLDRSSEMIGAAVGTGIAHPAVEEGVRPCP